MRLARRPSRLLAALLAASVLAGACAADGDSGADRLAPPPAASDEDTRADAPPTSAAAPDPFARPAWLGQRPLPLRPDGFGEIVPTPAELVDRRLATPDLLPAPPDDSFHSSLGPVPADVAARSTWQEACPVRLEDLRYATVSFWGFDGRHHTGEFIANRDAADQLVAAFRRMHAARFPIEEVRVTRADELDAHPTGDGNVTGVFVCRPTVGRSSWSEHAFGRAIDINPFHNPYVVRDIVVPELASAYIDRTHVRPGMITAGDAVVQAFAEIGWTWGGNWRSSKDWMHFSPSGR